MIPLNLESNINIQKSSVSGTTQKRHNGICQSTNFNTKLFKSGKKLPWRPRLLLLSWHLF